MACRSGGVFAARPAPGAHDAGPQKAFSLESVEERVKGSRAQLVTMVLEFFDHAEAKNRLFASVIEDVDADQAGVDSAPIGLGVFVMAVCIGFRHRKAIVIVEKESASVNASLIYLS
jgi:hypothetical protein